MTNFHDKNFHDKNKTTRHNKILLTFAQGPYSSRAPFSVIGEMDLGPVHGPDGKIFLCDCLAIASFLIKCTGKVHELCVCLSSVSVCLSVCLPMSVCLSLSHAVTRTTGCQSAAIEGLTKMKNQSLGLFLGNS